MNSAAQTPRPRRLTPMVTIDEISDDSFGGRLYNQIMSEPAGSRDSAAQAWMSQYYWAELETGGFMRGTLVGVDTKARCFVFVNASDPERQPQHRISAKHLYPVNPPMLDSADDLTALTHLHPPAVLAHLQRRYIQGRIYTFSGPILIAINPYQRVDDLYTPDALSVYTTHGSGTEAPRNKPRIPHVYAIGDQAYRAMRAFQQNQSILVTGESGAGKARFFIHDETIQNFQTK